MAAELAVVIVSWNTRQLLLDCLASLEKQRPEIEFEVWVVDNNSTDGSADAVRTLFPKVRLIVNQENIGYARANNQALNACASPIILMLNPDTEVQAGALRQVKDFFNQHPEAGIAGLKLLNPDGSRQLSARRFPSLLTALTGNLWLKRLPADKIAKVDWVSGAAWAVKKEVLQRVGPLDEKLFLFSEEMDLCRRARLAGQATYYFPEAAAVHQGGKSVRQWSGDEFRQLNSSLFYYYRKHHGPVAAAVFRFLAKLGWRLRCFKWQIMSLWDKKNEVFRQRAELYRRALEK